MSACRPRPTVTGGEVFLRLPKIPGCLSSLVAGTAGTNPAVGQVTKIINGHLVLLHEAHGLNKVPYPGHEDHISIKLPQ